MCALKRCKMLQLGGNRWPNVLYIITVSQLDKPHKVNLAWLKLFRSELFQRWNELIAAVILRVTVGAVATAGSFILIYHGLRDLSILPESAAVQE